MYIREAATSAARLDPTSIRMVGMDRELRVAGDLAAVLTVPAQPRLGLVPLHPASGPSRDTPLIRHLADALPPIGVAVLRYDRRPGEDIPFPVQVADAAAAVAELRRAIDPALPIVLWGFSQGAWVALLAARELGAAGIVVVGASGVSPALQMRDASARRIREAGFGEAAVEQMMSARLACEDVLRGGGDPVAAQGLLDAAASAPWWPQAWLPPAISRPPAMEWPDMDFDPAPLVRALPCPLLAVVGDGDRWVPYDESLAVLRTAPDVEVLHVAGGDHAPTEDGEGMGAPLPGYEAGLIDWIERRMAG